MNGTADPPPVGANNTLEPTGLTFPNHCEPHCAGGSAQALGRTEVILGGAPLFRRCQQVPRLTAGASFALAVSQACVPTCPEYMSPCPKPFDVARLQLESAREP